MAGSATGGTSQTLEFTPEAGSNRIVSSSFGVFGYDGNGNQIGRPGSETVTYTAFDLPKQISGSRSVAFLYDATGARAKKRKSDSEYTIYVADLYEKRVVGSAADHIFYIVADGRAVAQVIRQQGGGLSALEAAAATTNSGSNEVVLYLHDDRLGSVDAVTNSSGAVVERAARDPFGNEVKNFNEPSLPGIVTSGSRKVRLGFTGHEQDDDLGLINMRGRLYDGRLGRFLTPDPLVTAPLFGQSYNRYSYAFGNPLKYVDPSGFENQGPGGGDRAMAFDETGNGCGPGMWRLAGGGCYTLNELYAYARSMGNGLTCSGRVCEMRPHTFTDDPPGRSSPGSIESTPQPSAANPATPTTTTNDPMGQMTGVPPKKPDTKKAACCGCACGGAPQRGNKGVFTNWLKDAAIEGFAWMALIGGASPSPFSDGTPAPLDIRGRLAELEGEYPVPFMVLGVSEPLVTDPKLQNLVRDLYKGARTQAPIGTGSTADAIRHELATGQQVGGRWHSQKGREYITALTKWLSKNLGASAADRAAAQSIAQDICDALAGK